MERITIATGKKKYEIVDENNKTLGIISFNPADFNFYSRVQNFLQEINGILGKIETADENNIGIISKVDKELKQRLNELFDDKNLSRVVFGEQSCLNRLNGETFLERFVAAIMPIIETEMKKEMEKSNDRISKYVGETD